MRIAVKTRPQLFARPLFLFTLATIFILLSSVTARTVAQGTKAGAGHLLIYSIDVEGGQATLLVSPSGASLLVDTGWPGNNGRDAGRIQAAMKDAGITKIDHLLITHFHVDHVGGVPHLVSERAQSASFSITATNREDSDITRHDYAAYLKAIEGKPRRIVHPGDTIDIPGLNTIVLTADGEHIEAVPGVKPKPNPYCASEPKWDLDTTENPRSAGILVTLRQIPLSRPRRSDQGQRDSAGLPQQSYSATSISISSTITASTCRTPALFVDAIHPRVAIMNNGAHKAGSPEAWQTVHDSPGLEDL